MARAVEEADEVVLRDIVTWIDAFPLWLRKFLYFFLFSITPEVPKDLWLQVKSESARQVWWGCFAATFVAVHAIFSATCLASGRFFHDGNDLTINYLEDRWNIFLYSTVVPGYVASAFVIFGFVNRYWYYNEGVHVGDADVSLWRRIRLFLAITTILVFAGFLISNYQSDALSNQSFKGAENELDVGLLYWFADDRFGVQVLNRAGLAYIVVNFVLLVITMVGAMAYTSLVAQAMADTRRLTACTPEFIVRIPGMFRPFMRSTTYAQVVTICYLGNIAVWKLSPVGKATLTNIYISMGLVLMLGVAGTQLPKIYVNYKLGRFRTMCLAAGTESEALDDIPQARPWVVFASTLAMTIITGIFMSLAGVSWTDYAVDGFKAFFE